MERETVTSCDFLILHITNVMLSGAMIPLNITIYVLPKFQPDQTVQVKRTQYPMNCVLNPVEFILKSTKLHINTQTTMISKETTRHDLF